MKKKITNEVLAREKRKLRKQKKELKSLKARVESGKAELTSRRKIAKVRLEKRYQNVLADLTKTQSIETKHALKIAGPLPRKKDPVRPRPRPRSAFSTPRNSPRKI